MIDAIFIPTYRRTKQYSYNNFPKDWQKKTLLVVDEQDSEKLGGMGYNTLVCDCQGKGTAIVREWIAKYARKNKIKKYGVWDDDVYNACYTRLATEKDKYPLWNTKLTEPQWHEMFALMDEWLDEFVTCGLEVCWNPPLEKMFHQNFRQTVTHFYNDEMLPLDKLNFTDIYAAEDYNIILQLLTMGYQNRVSLRYRTRPIPTQQQVGDFIRTDRSIEVHNQSMEQLKAKFPDFVKLYEKVTKEGVGKWGGKPKLAAEIFWKKAYQSSQKVPTQTLEEFFA